MRSTNPRGRIKCSPSADRFESPSAASLTRFPKKRTGTEQKPARDRVQHIRTVTGTQKDQCVKVASGKFATCVC
jgi:hypothetical protein